MFMEEYKKALRQGQRDYRSCLAQGIYPYLQVLNEIMPNLEEAKRVELGLVDIPMERIVGTLTQGRSKAFSRNFLPLLEPDSEFADKWAHLCQAQSDEGIRDPVKAFEYMNHFYIQEGNKRVSVLRWCGAPSVTGQVVRIMPLQSDGKEYRIYCEFLDFYRDSKVNFIWFTREGGFDRLNAALGRGAGQHWTQEERNSFRAQYLKFREVFKARSGGKLSVTTGDALLVYLSIYSYDTLKSSTPAQVKEAVERIWDEILALTQDQAVKLSMEPPAAGGQKGKTLPLLNKLIPAGGARKIQRVKVSFLHEKDPETSAWTYGHEMGCRHLERALKDRVEVERVFHAEELADPAARLEEMAAGGSQMIFTTTPKLMAPSLKVSVRHPEVKVLNCSINMPHPQLRTYYGRIHEAKFLCGAIAGAMADDNRVGYVATYPTYGMTAGINAFALGARMANPRAEIFLEWTAVRGREADRLLLDRGIRVISGQDMGVLMGDNKPFGLYMKTDTGFANLAVAVWHWGIFYERIVHSLLSGSWQDEGTQGGKALNYWWGLSSGAVDVFYSSRLPIGTRRLVDLLRKTLMDGILDPFGGALYAQGGPVKRADDPPLTPEQVITMPWLAENVVGAIPSPEELLPEARALVSLQGVQKKEGEETP